MRSLASLSLLLLSAIMWAGRPATGEYGPKSPLMHHAFELADLNNWGDAEPEFAKAAVIFRKNGDRRNLAYAELGFIRATIQTRNLAITSAQLQHRLDSDPLMESDHELRLFCAAIKGEIDGEMEAPAMRDDWQEVARLAQESSDPRWRYRASAELGMAAFYEGDRETARRNIAGALVAATQAHDVGGQIRYLYAIGLGLNMARMNNEAIPYLDKAIALSSATPAAPYPYMPYLAKADALLALGHVGEAKTVAEGMLMGEQHRKASQYEALTFQTLAHVDIANGDLPAAISHLNQSATICEAQGYKRALIDAEIELADIYKSRGEFRKTEQLLASAAAGSQQNGEVYTLPQRLQVLADLQTRQGKFAEADRTYDRAAAFVDASIGNDSAVLDKTGWVKSVSDMYVAHFSLIAEHLNNPTKAYSVIEQVRGRVMTDLLLGGSAALMKACAQEKQISALHLRMMAANSTAEVEKIRDQVFQLEQSSWLTPEISVLKSRRYTHVPLRDVQRALSPKATILEYVLAEPASWCLVIRREGVGIVRLAGKSRIESLVKAYLTAVKEKQTDRTAARDLYEGLLQPVRITDPRGDVIVVRDGLLNLLPFDALRDAAGKYVGEQTVVSYLPSAGSFYLLAEQINKPDQNRRVLAVGAVPYDQEAARLKKVIATHGFEDTILSNLQNSREEAIAATAGTPQKDATVVLGAAATESALKKAAAERYRVIHLAVHSVVDTNDPDRAALIFLDDPAAGDDGLLQAPEIAQLRLHTDLVVLSACDTVVGPIEGQEGVATLGRSFLLAGAQNVISTLWATDDNSSLALLKRFYSHLSAGDSAALSLAEAKREFLTRFRSEAVPYYWAAFTFEGVPNTATIFHDQRRNTHYSANAQGANLNRKSD